MKNLPALCLLLISVPVGAAEETVQLEAVTDALKVSIGGRPFAVYNVAASQPKPYFWPIVGPGDVTITRPLEGPEDHPHHKGVWCAIDEVNDVKFWAEKGRIVNVSVDILESSGSPARFRAVNHWLGEGDVPLLKETATVSIYANRLMVYDISFSPAGDAPVTFHDTKEGLFGIRLSNELREKGGTGKVLNAEGLEGSVACWGQASKWIDYYGAAHRNGPGGQADRGQTVGVALFDHPENFRPSRYHVRNYGLFTLSPFGEKAYTGGKSEAQPVTLEPGESLRLRYGLYVHAGDTKEGRVAEVYEEFVKAAGKGE